MIQGTLSDTGPNSLDVSHFQFRRPKNIPLIDQLNRIDMMGFHKFIEAISCGQNGKSETPHPPPRLTIRQTINSNNNHNQPQSPRPPITRRTSTSVSQPLNSPKKQSPKGGGMVSILQALDENSISKPASSIAGACKIIIITIIIIIIIHIIYYI